EVFRFLTKPCPPKQLRDTVELAAKLARSTPAIPPSEDRELSDQEALEIILEGDTVSEAPASRGPTVETSDGREFTSTTVLPDAPRIAAKSRPAVNAPRAAAPRPEERPNGPRALAFSSVLQMRSTA